MVAGTIADCVTVVWCDEEVDEDEADDEDAVDVDDAAVAGANVVAKDFRGMKKNRLAKITLEFIEWVCEIAYLTLWLELLLRVLPWLLPPFCNRFDSIWNCQKRLECRFCMVSP